MAYLDNAGLYRKYGTEKTPADNAGEYRTAGALREIELKLDLTTLTETETIQSDVVFFPKMRVQEVVVVTHTAAATGTAIDLGLIQTDRTTEIDYDGFLVALTTAQMSSTGERIVLTNESGVTGEGALIGTTTTNVGYITASRTTATAYTAGVIFVTIKYYAA